MKPGVYFSKWYRRVHPFRIWHGQEGDYRKAFEKGRRYEQQYGKKRISKSEAMRALVKDR
jgi:hypothetical protein